MKKSDGTCQHSVCIIQDCDLTKNIVDYHMRVHIFGNSPLPAVAIHNLHQSVQVSKFHVDPDVKNFVMHDFYVDDCLKSLPTVMLLST